MQKIFLITLLLVSLLPSARTLNVVNFGANGKDKIDDTSAFQKCVNQLASEGGGTMEIPNGIYYISHLKFFGKKYSNITIRGFSSTIRQILPAKRISAHKGMYQTFAERLAADGCFVFDAMVSHQQDDSESIKNIKISGLKFETEVQKVGFDELMHQISAHGVSNFSLDNCSFTGFLGDGIAINAGTDVRINVNAYNKDIFITNSKFDGVNNNNRQGISIYYADGFLIENCSFKNITREDMPGAIDIEPNSDSQVSRNGIIRNCTFENIGGNAAVVIHTHAPEKKNKFSHRNFIVENCSFNNVNQALSVKGYGDFRLLIDKKKYTTTFKNNIVTNARAIAHIREAYNVLFLNSTFENISNASVDSIIEGGASNITFDGCRFANIASPHGVAFIGETLYINVVNSTFAVLNKNAITISDVGGIGNIVNNTFISSKNYRALPLVTSANAAKNVPRNAVIKNNKSLNSFKPVTLEYVFRK